MTVTRHADGIWRPSFEPLEPPATYGGAYTGLRCDECGKRKTILHPRPIPGHMWKVQRVCVVCMIQLNGKARKPKAGKEASPTIKAPPPPPIPEGWYTMEQAGKLCNRQRVTIHCDVQKMGLGRRMRKPGQEGQGPQYRMLSAAEVEQLRSTYRQRDQENRRGWRKERSR